MALRAYDTESGQAGGLCAELSNRPMGKAQQAVGEVEMI